MHNLSQLCPFLSPCFTQYLHFIHILNLIFLHIWQYGTEKMSLPSVAANKPVVLPKMGKVSLMQRYILNKSLHLAQKYAHSPDICPRALSVPRRWTMNFEVEQICPRTNIWAYFCAKWRLLSFLSFKYFKTREGHPNLETFFENYFKMSKQLCRHSK